MSGVARGPGHGIGVICCILAAIAWGTTGTAASFAPGVSAVAIGAAAMGLGGLMQAMVAWRGIHRGRGALLRHRWLLIAGAVSVALYPLAFYSSMRLAGVTIGTVISIGSAPLISALIENRLEGGRLTFRWGIGALIGLAGMVLLSLAETDHGAIAPNIPMGVGLGLVAGGTYALYSWTARRVMQRGVPAPAAMGATFGLGGLLLLPILIATGAPFLESARNFGVGFYMAVVPMFLGYIAFGQGLARISSSLATTITLLEPVVAALLAVLLVGERLPPSGWTGVALIVGCLFWITVPVPSRRDAPRPAAPVVDPA